MVNRKRSGIDDPRSTETVTTEPLLVPPSQFDLKHKLDVFRAVDYLGTRFRIGDHVAMYTGEGKEWVCALELLYRDPKTAQAKFKGRWFWSVDDVLQHTEDVVETMRPSKCEAHELISCDNRDTNLVESISRKCHILSFENFQLVKKLVTKPNCPWGKIYFCERQFYHKANHFSELNSVLFPGDPIPRELRVAAGLPEIPPLQFDGEDSENGYREPESSARPRGRSARTEEAKSGDTLAGGPLFIW